MIDKEYGPMTDEEYEAERIRCLVMTFGKDNDNYLKASCLDDGSFIFEYRSPDRNIVVDIEADQIRIYNDRYVFYKSALPVPTARMSIDFYGDENVLLEWLDSRLPVDRSI
jgi:hypothetical protein